MANKFIYKEGDLINGVELITEIERTNIHRRGRFKCKCGKTFESSFNNIKTGTTKSCGCQRFISWLPRRKERKVIYCACGCGESLIGIDNRARVRKFIHGHNKGHNMPHSKEVSAKLRVMRVGMVSSIETRRKQSLNAARGEKNSNWKGGVTSINEKIRKSVDYKIWRETVFKRDNYTCQGCGERESVSGKLQADHIKPFAYFPELRFEIDNGRTLCKECHKKTDTYLVKAKLKYGYFRLDTFQITARH